MNAFRPDVDPPSPARQRMHAPPHSHPVATAGHDHGLTGATRPPGRRVPTGERNPAPAQLLAIACPLLGECR